MIGQLSIINRLDGISRVSEQPDESRLIRHMSGSYGKKHGVAALEILDSTVKHSEISVVEQSAVIILDQCDLFLGIFMFVVLSRQILPKSIKVA